MKKLFKRTVMLSAALLMTSAMWAAVIGAGADASAATGVSVVGCGDTKPQQAMGITMDCTKGNGEPGKQCVTNETVQASNCEMKVIECQ